jgi:hypothetical protein
MRVSAQVPSQREWVLPQRQFRMPAKNVAKPEQAEEEHPRRQQTDTERYLLQIDRQTKRSFKTSEAAQAMAVEIKARFPILQVSIYAIGAASRPPRTACRLTRRFGGGGPRPAVTRSAGDLGRVAATDGPAGPSLGALLRSTPVADHDGSVAVSG